MTVSEIKNDYKLYLHKVKKEIPALLEGAPLSRKALVDKLVALSPLTDEDKKDMGASGALAMYRSIIGTAIKRLEQYGDISVSAHNEITLVKKPSVIVRETEISRYIIDFLKNRTCTAKEITAAALGYFGADRTHSASDDDSIEQTVKKLLPDLVRRGKLTCAYGKYALCSDTIVIKRPRSLFEEFITLINSKGGEFFENYSAILLDKYYRSLGMQVAYCNVIGGSDDGGIDVIMNVSDQLGFNDKILIQCKQKSGSNVTLKELKEFVGAYYVEKGTRGIFMTNSRFHKEASLLFSELGDIIPIDGPKLFDIAKKCECGIKMENGEYKIDEEFFAI